MARKKKINRSKDLDVKILKAWYEFRKSVASISEACDCTVELGFESSQDSRTHYRFEPDDPIFLMDTIVSADGKLRLCTPGAMKYKTFTFEEAEVISCNSKESGVVSPLSEVLTAVFNDAFAGIEEANSASKLEQLLREHSDMIVVLNNVDASLRQLELKQQREEAYQTIPNYGIF
jgi:hypothetical protein